MGRTIVAAAFLLLCQAGCGDSSPATFGGKILHKGKAVPSGVVYFLGPAPEMRMGMGTITEGTYSATDIPLGRVRVSLQAPGIPEKFTDPNTSELAFEIVPGMKTLNIEIP